MKKSIGKKLFLNKQTIAHLDKKSMHGLFGGNGDVTNTESCPNSCIKKMCNVVVEETTECPQTH